MRLIAAVTFFLATIEAAPQKLVDNIEETHNKRELLYDYYYGDYYDDYYGDYYDAYYGDYYDNYYGTYYDAYAYVDVANVYDYYYGDYYDGTYGYFYDGTYGDYYTASDNTYYDATYGEYSYTETTEVDSSPLGIFICVLMIVLLVLCCCGICACSAYNYYQKMNKAAKDLKKAVKD